jgi:DNA-binding NarL/FixJ family response regulator
LVDDYAPWRRYITSRLQKQPELQVVCEVSDGLEAIEQTAKLQPDLILLDIGLPNLNGIEVVRRIRDLAPKSKVLIVSQYPFADVVQEAFSLGACGYVDKSDAGSELLPAVEAVIQGKKFVSSRLAGFSLTPMMPSHSE